MFEQPALLPFQPDHAREVAPWVISATEASQWANTQWPVEPAIFVRWHADSEVQPYVLVDGAHLVGYGELWLDATEQEVELARLLVAPAVRGQGVGQRLVRALLSQAALSGYPTAFIRVVPANVVALRCYQRSGFQAVTLEEQERFNHGQPVDYLWLRYPLHLTP